MGDSIDLDEIEIETDDDGEEGAHGDWFWRGEGDPDDEPESRWSTASSPTADAGAAPDEGETESESDAAAESGGESGSADEDDGAAAANDADAQPRTPKIPGDPKGPVGVPESKGGSGGGSPSRDAAESTAAESTAGSTPTPDPSRTTNHGEETTPSDMTLAFTYEAINRLADPQFAVNDARGWADWIGIVGKVSTPVIRKFQRDQTIELDFFGGSDTGPDQRLVDITPDSMFYADRMVLVGTEGDEWIAEAADWEFVPLGTAAEKAGWDVEFEE